MHASKWLDLGQAPGEGQSCSPAAADTGGSSARVPINPRAYVEPCGRSNGWRRDAAATRLLKHDLVVVGGGQVERAQRMPARAYRRLQTVAPTAGLRAPQTRTSFSSASVIFKDTQPARTVCPVGDAPHGRPIAQILCVRARARRRAHRRRRRRCRGRSWRGRSRRRRGGASAAGRSGGRRECRPLRG